MEQKQPRMVQKALLRAALLLFALAVGFLAIRWMIDYRKGTVDLGGHADTVGAIAAIRYLPDGSQVVMIKPDGTILESADYAPGRTDQEAAWLPSGERIFFSSDRKGDSFHIYRWNPGKNVVEQMTAGSASHSTPFFSADSENSDNLAIITSRGVVLQYDPADSSMLQLLPPQGREIGATDEGGVAGQFDELYRKFGSSFVTARWMMDRSYIAAVMNRDEGQVLVLQNMNPEDRKGMLPIVLAVGERIDIDVDAAGNRLVFSCRNFQLVDDVSPDEAVKNPGVKRQKPYENAVGIVDLTTGVQPKWLALDHVGKTPYSQPAISGDGSRILFVQGGPTKEQSTLILATIQDLAQAKATANPLIAGEIYEPAWSPDGSKIAFVKQENGHRAIYVAGGDGSDAKSLTGDKGDFGFPRFSPMKQ